MSSSPGRTRQRQQAHLPVEQHALARGKLDLPTNQAAELGRDLACAAHMLGDHAVLTMSLSLSPVQARPAR